MSNSNRSSSGGIGFIGLLTILFIGLKITKYIDWPWIWVLSPVWISWAVVFGFLGMIAIIMALARK